jgi:hypothetical protein
MSFPQNKKKSSDEIELISISYSLELWIAEEFLHLWAIYTPIRAKACQSALSELLM